ncbi:hypothetical protein [Aminipila terrae]|uniref:Uncharacterized protein n=1 Tax=Aminipila terrae TaxID=2697030 RepID=A0A6P1MBH5_9FIRM|nr:hypothetical protein [Aminipila terrae]QHI71382.1 hypothetical protein Ami3637_02375 [Aminipila terrae]
MLMSFEKYMSENYEFTKEFENLASYPSVFELICLLPLSRKSTLLEAPFSLDDCII